jgi:histidine phosphotransferase ChpT
MVDELQMAELLCTRLCHDLTGPIGAVHNGAEFLSEEGFNMQGQAVELIVSSAFSAVSRLQFYRMAYGIMRDHGEASLADKKKLVIDFFAGSKITLDWPDSHTDASGVSISLKMSRLVFNLIILSNGALIRGGTITVRLHQETDGHKKLLVSANGPGLKWDAELDKVLAGDTEVALSPKNVQAYLTRKFVEELKATLVCHVDGETLTMQVVQ